MAVGNEKQSHSHEADLSQSPEAGGLHPLSLTTSTTSTAQEPEAVYPSSPQALDLEKQASQRSKPTLTTYLSRTVSRASHLAEPGPPPDGGATAWSQAIISHLVICNTWGYISTYGVFQNYYSTTLGQTQSAISWVGSVQIFLLFFVGTFSGRLTDAGYFRAVFTAGSLMGLLGVFLTSLCTRYWQLFLAQGILTGLGNGMLFCPTIALTSHYWSKRRGLALGIGASGTATGGVVFPAIAVRLLPRVGFAWTVRTIGFVMLVTQTVAWLVLKPRLPPRRSGPLVEWAAFKELPYLLFSMGMFLNFWGLYCNYFYIGQYANTVIGLSRTESIYTLMILNGVGIPGRLIPNYLADRFAGPINMLIPFVIGAAVMLYGWIGVQDQAGLTAFAVIYGFFAAGVQSLFPASLSSLTTDVKKMGTRIGMVFSVVSFATLTGSPIFGALTVDPREGGRRPYLHAQIYVATVLLVGSCLLCCARIAKTGLKLKMKV